MSPFEYEILRSRKVVATGTVEARSTAEAFGAVKAKEPAEGFDPDSYYTVRIDGEIESVAGDEFCAVASAKRRVDEEASNRFLGPSILGQWVVADPVDPADPLFDSFIEAGRAGSRIIDKAFPPYEDEAPGGANGYWRESFTPEQAGKVERIVAVHGYDPSWILGAVRDIDRRTWTISGDSGHSARWKVRITEEMLDTFAG